MIYAVVKHIPPGRVATYGHIAKLATRGGHARLFGYALNGAPANTNIPWHRVVNTKGEISARGIRLANGGSGSVWNAKASFLTGDRGLHSPVLAGDRETQPLWDSAPHPLPIASGEGE